MRSLLFITDQSAFAGDASIGQQNRPEQLAIVAQSAGEPRWIRVLR
jgi:hypothetical protein